MKFKFSRFAGGIWRRIRPPNRREEAIERDFERIKDSGLFDPEYYLQTYSDVADSGLDPLRHFVQYGLQHGRDPCAFFDGEYYLASNPDVASAGVEPLWHFVDHGWHEFRLPSPKFDSRRYFIEHLSRAGKAINPLAHFLSLGRGQGVAAPAVEQTQSRELRRMRAAAYKALDSNDNVPLNSTFLALLARACLASGLEEPAEKALQKVATQEPLVADHHAALAQFYARQKRWWLVESSMARAVDLNNGRPDWLAVLADAQEAMNRYSDAEETLRSALDLIPENAQMLYRLGLVLERQGHHSSAEDAYQSALNLSDDAEAKRWGVGVFHEQSGAWREACQAYSAKLEIDSQDPELQLRLGKLYDALFDLEKAEACYVAAITTVESSTKQPADPHWHFWLGKARERMGKFRLAATSYEAAIALLPSPPSLWQYRLGCARDEAGQHEQACAAFAAMATSNETNEFAVAPEVQLSSSVSSDECAEAKQHYEMGLRCEAADDFNGAAEAYTAALARSESHQPNWYFRLGKVLSACGHWAQASMSYRQTQVLQRPYDNNEESLSEDSQIWRELSYLEYCECLPLCENVILYESFAGRSLSCNPLAVFRQILDHPEYDGFLHVWTLNDRSRIPEDLRGRENVVFVSKNCDGYLRYLATAKYLINNNGFEPFFVRRDGQKYLETWHGTPLKTLGKDQKYRFYDHKHAQRNFVQASHLISANPHMTQVLLNSYDLRSLATAKLAETGYPRVAATLNVNAQRRQNLRERLRLEPGQPVVLYAPTWRGVPDDARIDTSRLEDDISRMAQLPCELLFRGHNFLEGKITAGNLDCVVVPDDIDTNELLSIVDVLVTDYSSIFFDFMPLGRPIIHYVFDLEEYENQRGLYFPIEDMPGHMCRDAGELVRLVEKALQEQLEPRPGLAKLQAKFCPKDDGEATQRVVDFFLHDTARLTWNSDDETRPTVLFASGSFAPNGITASFLNLTRSIDPDRVNVALGFTPETVEARPLNRAQFEKLPASVAVVPRHGRLLMTPDEQRAWSLEEQGMVLSRHARQLRDEVLERDFIRTFGSKAFDTVISFAGYDPFWTGLMLANSKSCRRIAYLHNDMHAEYRARFPELIRVFHLYSKADKLISVSAATNDINKNSLSTLFALPEGKFDYCDNVIDHRAIDARAKCELADSKHDEIFAGEGPAFINVGRLSVEKDHAKLIHAFAPIVASRPTARLAIIGTGPLDGHLRSLIDELGLQDSVHLLGHCDNPYPYFRVADCFVLSSNHEGQGLVLLEALVIGTPIVATGIEGVQSVLKGSDAKLVANSVEGLTAGMHAFLRGEVGISRFDAAAYRDKALTQFYERVLGLT